MDYQSIGDRRYKNKRVNMKMIKKQMLDMEVSLRRDWDEQKKLFRSMILAEMKKQICCKHETGTDMITKQIMNNKAKLVT